MTRRHKRQQVRVLRNSNNKITLGTEDKLATWIESIQTLFDDDRLRVPPPTNKEINEKGTEIDKEFILVIKTQKNRKATAPDKINVEILKLIAENEIKDLYLITSLFNEIYNLDKIPSDGFKS